MAVRVTLKNFQSFDESGAGVADIKRVNVLIGPNNAGKSKILKAVDSTIRDGDNLLSESGTNFVVEVERPLSEAELRRIFPKTTNWNGLNSWAGIGANLGGTSVVIEHRSRQKAGLKETRPSIGDPLAHYNQRQITDHVLREISAHFQAGIFERLPASVHYIEAERDVVAESASDDETIHPNGRGTTNLIRRVLTQAGREKASVEVWLLADLNRILAPDHEFSRIQVRQREDQRWEIYLEEKGKGLLPLSQCGSGLRTLIHLLALTNIVIPRVGKKIADGTLLIEELENCLHPHVQRNVFAYLDEIVAETSRLFMTTHSSVCLDYFQGHDDVILTQVFQETGKTRARTIEAFRDKCGALDRMGSRASEALQSNAVVWVEGPSDRTYLKHWLDLCEAEIVEGRDYSIMFYGGDLLAHLTMDASQEAQEFIRLLAINRNSAIVIDSDKTYQAEPIRETKRRVKEEADAQGRFVWITKGKEIENYIAPPFFARHFSPPPSFTHYDAPWDTVKGAKPIGGTRAFNAKVEFAEFVRKNATKEDYQLDWEERTRDLLKFLLSANGR